MWMTTIYLRNYSNIALVLLTLALADPAFSAQPDAAYSALPDAAIDTPVETHSLPTVPLQLEAADLYQKPSLGDFHLFMPAARESGRWKTDFSSRQQARSGNNLPVFVMQRGEYSGNGLSLLAEMGDIRILETPYAMPEISGKGGRFAVAAENSGSALKMQTFASSGGGVNGSDGLLVGATGEISLLAESARFKTLYLSGRQALRPGARPSEYGERKGDVLGLVAILEPFKGRLAAEAELDFVLFDFDSADEADAVRDSACRVKIGGEWGRYRYNALYERTGPNYRLMGGKGPKRDTEGVSLGLETAFRLHAFDLKLSRYHNNTENNELYPRLYKYEGLVDYSFNAIETLPVGLRYRKTFVDSSREPYGYLAKDSEEDAVSGRVNFLTGKWDLGLLASFSQRTDRLSEEREATATTFTFLPKFAAGPVTVSPDFSVKRSMDFPNSLRSEQFAVSLGINGSALEKKVDYEIKGGFKKERIGLVASRRETFGANLKTGYPFTTLFKSILQPSLGIKGEYNGTSDRFSDGRNNAFSLLFSVEGNSFL